MRAAFSGKASRPGELVGIEGFKALGEAFTAGLRFDAVALTAGEAMQHAEAFAQFRPRELLVVTDEVMASIADTVSPPRVAATVAIPEEDRPGPASGVFLLLEEIQDPGNVGTLIRSAEAFGVQKIFVSPGCANLWSPKVIRASAGSVFRQPAARQPMARTIDELRRQGVRIAGAVARREHAIVSLDAELKAPVGVVIGNEGGGLSDYVLSRVDLEVYIPCLTESLNAGVAGSVLLYEALSQSRAQQKQDRREGLKGSESNVFV